MTELLELTRIINQTIADNKFLDTLNYLKTNGTLTQKIVIEYLLYFYVNGFNLFKVIEWGHKYKINYKDKLATNPYKNLIIATYNICKECFFLQDISGVNIKYLSSGFKWFALCLVEFIWLDFNELIISEKEHVNYFGIWEDRLRKLKSQEYPSEDSKEYNPYLSDNCPALSILVEAAFSLQSKNPNFHKKYWMPFIEAHREIVSLKNSSYLKPVRLLPQENTCQSKLPGRGRYRKPKH